MNNKYQAIIRHKKDIVSFAEEPFSLERFKSFKEQKKRILYCYMHFPKAKAGSSRCVFKLDEKRALKVAMMKYGIRQNKTEVQNAQASSCFAKIYEYDKDFKWLIVQYAEPITQTKFKEIAGVDFEKVSHWLEVVAKKNYVSSLYSKEELEEISKIDFFKELKKVIETEYYNHVGEFKNLTAWGIVKDENEKEHLVICDYGMSNVYFGDKKF